MMSFSSACGRATAIKRCHHALLDQFINTVESSFCTWCSILSFNSFVYCFKSRKMEGKSIYLSIVAAVTAESPTCPSVLLPHIMALLNIGSSQLNAHTQSKL